MYNVFGFYKFKKINNIKKVKNFLYKLFLNHKIRGTIILSSEGINGTISGYKNDVFLSDDSSVYAHIWQLILRRTFWWKSSLPFHPVLSDESCRPSEAGAA